MPIVTSVCRSSSPVSRWKTQDLKQRADDRNGKRADDDAQKPVVAPKRSVVADIGAEQVERAVRQIDVAHEAEDERESAGDKKVEARQSHAVEHRADESFLAVEQPVEPVGPDPEHHPENDRGRKQRRADPKLARRWPLSRICDRQAHAVSRRRCSFIFGALWNSPSFMIARSRVLSCRMRTLAAGSPSTSSRSAR